MRRSAFAKFRSRRRRDVRCPEIFRCRRRALPSRRCSHEPLCPRRRPAKHLLAVIVKASAKLFKAPSSETRRRGSRASVVVRGRAVCVIISMSYDLLSFGPVRPMPRHHAGRFHSRIALSRLCGQRERHSGCLTSVVSAWRFVSHRAGSRPGTWLIGFAGPGRCDGPGAQARKPDQRSTGGARPYRRRSGKPSRRSVAAHSREADRA